MNLICMFFIVTVVCAFGQTQQSVTTENTATVEDLKKLQRQIQKSLAETDKNSVLRNKELKAAAEKTANEISVAEKKLSGELAEQKLETANRNTILEARQRVTNRLIFIAILTTVLIAFFGFVFV